MSTKGYYKLLLIKVRPWTKQIYNAFNNLLHELSSEKASIILRRKKCVRTNDEMKAYRSQNPNARASTFSQRRMPVQLLPLIGERTMEWNLTEFTLMWITTTTNMWEFILMITCENLFLSFLATYQLFSEPTVGKAFWSREECLGRRVGLDLWCSFSWVLISV